MILYSNGKVEMDYELDLLSTVTSIIDRSIEALINESNSCQDPDAYGIFDKIEHVTGFGFVACQTYINSTYPESNLSKKESLNKGKVHSCGLTYIALINHAANFWKHQGEWVNEGNSKARERIIQSFEELGYPVDLDYPISGCLTELTDNSTTFQALQAILEEWRNQIISAS